MLFVRLSGGISSSSDCSLEWLFGEASVQVSFTRVSSESYK